MVKRNRNNRPRRERKPEDRHAHAYLNELINYETKRKLEALRDELKKEAKDER